MPLPSKCSISRSQNLQGDGSHAIVSDDVRALGRRRRRLQHLINVVEAERTTRHGCACLPRARLCSVQTPASLPFYQKHPHHGAQHLSRENHVLATTCISHKDDKQASDLASMTSHCDEADDCVRPSGRMVPGAIVPIQAGVVRVHHGRLGSSDGRPSHVLRIALAMPTGFPAGPSHQVVQIIKAERSAQQQMLRSVAASALMPHCCSVEMD